MKSVVIEHDKFTVISDLKACSLVFSLIIGKEIHSQVIKSMYRLDVAIQTSLIDMYGKCGQVQYAQNLFNEIPHRTIITWNALIGCYALNLHPLESFTCLRNMQVSGVVHPDKITFINLLPSCAQVDHVHKLEPCCQDGKIEAEVKLTGILSLGALQPGESRKYGTTIAPGLYAPVHQHFFIAHMDMAVDCKPGETYNQVYAATARTEDDGKKRDAGERKDSKVCQ